MTATKYERKYCCRVGCERPPRRQQFRVDRWQASYCSVVCEIGQIILGLSENDVCRVLTICEERFADLAEYPEDEPDDDDYCPFE